MCNTTYIQNFIILQQIEEHVEFGDHQWVSDKKSHFMNLNISKNIKAKTSDEGIKFSLFKVNVCKKKDSISISKMRFQRGYMYAESVWATYK